MNQTVPNRRVLFQANNGAGVATKLFADKENNCTGMAPHQNAHAKPGMLLKTAQASADAGGVARRATEGVADEHKMDYEESKDGQLPGQPSDFQ